MPRRVPQVLAIVLASSVAMMGCGGTGSPPGGTSAATPTTAPIAGATLGFCGLISVATLEQAYGPMNISRNDTSATTGDAVHGSCDVYTARRDEFQGALLTLNVNSDPTREVYERTIVGRTTTPVTIAGAEVVAVNGGLLYFVAHKKATTIELGLKTSSDWADDTKDTAVALKQLEQALSHFS